MVNPLHISIPAITLATEKNRKIRMKSTALTEEHIALGAKMTPFAGYNMPVSYSGINDEHHTVRNAAGMFDVSHMGEFILKGDGAIDLIQRITTNDASKLTPGKAQYSCFTNEQGGIIDDLIVYCLPGNAWMLVVNASNIEKDWNHLVKNNTANVELHNISDKTSLLAVQGPKAKGILQKLTDINLDEIPYYHFTKGIFAGCENVLISNTGYTGSGGFELYFTNENALTIWNKILVAGRDEGLKPCGLGARDTLRLEMCFCLYGNDIDDTTTPLEAGLGWITKFTKEFTASSILQKQKEEGVKRKLIAFEVEGKGIPRKGYDLCCAEGKLIGHVTSGTQSPTLGKPIGMGYVKAEYATPGTKINLMVRDNSVEAKIIKGPFYKQTS
jgi:aminomethyltransferase